ncbi:MAG: hydrolase [Candidatus Muproteobacteria bacterium RBG_16_62_13]|uniref:Hydrolase n=1 Tax=Candidatus Muproteobacteria bacterium RBG_16_62_13 TaxID=1817756 RepID=A0A1F6T844_9PROT|nr:MAG: hydrolase [Candidatus Muproteobacteria bacterium RBG_16_62_13]
MGIVGKTDREVAIPLDGAEHGGDLGLPPGAQGLVIFAHGSGSSRRSSRNRFVAEALRSAGLATLLFDLLTEVEDRDYERRFDIDLLTRRLLGATAWARHQPELKNLMFGYFGASTGAAAALQAAAELGDMIDAVVSRGGRPDLAMESLARVTAPTLLIVGGHDEDVIELNRRAHARLTGVAELEIVPGATHLFEEPGALEEVARLASAWFRRYLRSPAPAL